MIKAILFDLDGTLANTDPLHYRTWQEVLAQHDLQIDRQFYQKRFSGRLNPDIIRDILPHLSPEAGQQLSDAKEATFRQRASEMPPLTGLLELMAWASDRHLKQAVVTNAPRANAEFLLTALKLTESFEFVVLAEDLPYGKPDPLPYRHALERLGLEPTEAIAFEDSPSGIQAAIAAGIPTIGVATTHNPEQLAALGTTLVIHDFTDPALWSRLETWVPGNQPYPSSFVKNKDS